MAITAPENPRFYSGPDLQLGSCLAKDSQTWIAGQFCQRSATTGKVYPIATNATALYGQFGDSQPTATSGNTVKVWRIVSPETSFVGYACKGANDAAASMTRAAASSAAVVTSGILTISDTTANGLFKVVDVLSNQQPYPSTTTPQGAPASVAGTVPGQVIFKPLSDAVIQA